MDTFPPSPFNWIDRLSPPVRERVLREHRPFSARNVRDAFQPGDRAPGIFRVIAGRVDMGAVQEDGTSVLFNCYFPGECFGELPVLDGGRHIATLSQARGARVSLLPLEAVVRLRQECPEFNEALTLGVCNTLRMLFALHLAKLSLSPEGQLLNRIADYGARLHNPAEAETRIPISQDEFARLLGISRRTVVVVLTELEQRGKIRRAYGAVFVRS